MSELLGPSHILLLSVAIKFHQLNGPFWPAIQWSYRHDFSTNMQEPTANQNRVFKTCCTTCCHLIESVMHNPYTLYILGSYLYVIFSAL